MELENKNIVVTGAASGIGAEVAKYLSSNGAKVTGLDINEVSENVARFVAVDLSDPNSIGAAESQLPDKIDALCNVAGVPPTAGVVPVMKVNVLGLQTITDAVISKMNNGGSIVNVASLAGAGWAMAVDSILEFQKNATFETVEAVCKQLQVNEDRCYFFAKEIVIAWTMQNRWTWRDRGIRMNCVSPGPVETPILPEFLESLGEKAKKNRDLMDRFGTPSDVAPTVGFLCSDASAWIRGSNIPCDGGMLSHIQCEQNGLN